MSTIISIPWPPNTEPEAPTETKEQFSIRLSKVSTRKRAVKRLSKEVFWKMQHAQQGLQDKPDSSRNYSSVLERDEGGYQTSSSSTGKADEILPPTTEGTS